MSADRRGGVDPGVTGPGVTGPGVAGSPKSAGDGTAARSVGRTEPWASVRQKLHARGLRWTTQRRLLVEVLSGTNGHVTGVELVERCRSVDPATIPSTVYRTLDMLEELGLVRHCHGADGREEFHVLPEAEHGHIYCADCEGSWEIGPAEAAGLVDALLAARGFEVDLSHVTVVGRCAACRGSTGVA